MEDVQSLAFSTEKMGLFTCLLFMIPLNIWISISNEIPTLTVQISVKTDPYSELTVKNKTLEHIYQVEFIFISQPLDH